MNRRILTLLTAALILGFAVQSQAEKPRKLPAGAYLKSAKIEIISGDTVRYAGAMAMLDTLMMYYGPHAEGLYWLSQIQVDFVEKSSNPQQKSLHIMKILTYADSLKRMCADAAVDEKNKKDCGKWVAIVDSLKVKYWGEFYNRGVEQLNAAKDLQKEKEGATDSVTIAFSEKGIKANSDSAIENLTIAISVNPADFRSYIAIGNVYEGLGNYEEALNWTKKGADKVSDRTELLIPLAMYNINLDRYCDAIPYFREFVDKNPEEVGTMYNLSICYSRCEQFDSAVAIYRLILTKDPKHSESISRMGEYFIRLAKLASDSISAHSGEAGTAKLTGWKVDRDHAYDSSAYWFSKSFELNPEDVTGAGQYALIQALRGKFDLASIGYKKLTELEPKDPNHWIYLGDCFVQLKSFKEAIKAYEQAEALDDSKTAMLNTMLDIYSELRDEANVQRMTAKLAKRK